MRITDASPNLYNEDLAPAQKRNWGAFSIFNVWTSDVHSLWVITLLQVCFCYAEALLILLSPLVRDRLSSSF